MKRKPVQPSEPVISPDLLEQAKKSIHMDTVVRQEKCTVCGSECAASANPENQLCWVCRRLKISAWRDADGVTPTGTGVVVRHPQTGVCELWRTPAVLTEL